MNDKEKREGQPKEPQVLLSLESGERETLLEELAGKEDKEGMVGQPNQGSTPNSGTSKSDLIVPPEVQADEPKAQPDTPESAKEEKEKEIQPQEPTVSLPKDHGADKSDKVEENEAPAYEQSRQKPDNPLDIFRRDIKRIKSSADDSFNRLGKKINDLLNLDDKGENK